MELRSALIGLPEVRCRNGTVRIIVCMRLDGLIASLIMRKASNVQREMKLLVRCYSQYFGESGVLVR